MCINCLVVTTWPAIVPSANQFSAKKQDRIAVGGPSPMVITNNG
jgi:hypothetical protein